jgi:predicted hydrocarbon binding protein
MGELSKDRTARVRARGNSLQSTKQFIRERGGPEALVKVLGQLPPHARRVCGRTIDPAAWVDLDVWLAFAEAADRVLGQGDGALHRVIGRYTAERDLYAVYSRFPGGAAGLAGGDALTPNIAMLAGFVVDFWRQYFSSGTATLEVNEPGRVVACIRGFAEPAAPVCARVLGFMEEASARAGARDVAATHTQCRAAGAEDCRFELRWTPRASA